MIRPLRALVHVHRYLGIALSLLFVIWFASGIVMIYVGAMPSVTAQQRIQKLPELNLAAIILSPMQAARRAGRDARAPTLTSILERPAYRFQGRGGVGATVFADNGELQTAIDVHPALFVASRFAAVPAAQVRYVRTLKSIDQWTLSQRRDLPLFKFELDDAAATQIYVSSQRAEVVQLTTRKTRALAWAGTIPHWLYFAALRANQPLWYQIVVWTSGLGCILAVMGLVLAFTQFKQSKPFRLKASIPYRSWMRWHYIVGALFGVFALTWVFSGLLSMDSFAWMNTRGLEIQRDALNGGAPELASFALPDAGVFSRLTPGHTIKEIAFTRIQGDNYYSIRSVASDSRVSTGEAMNEANPRQARVDSDSLLVSATTMEIRTESFSVASLLARLSAAAPGVPIVESRVLSDYDSYYYSRGRQLPLPVLRVKFADPAESWVYIDPQRSEIRSEVDRNGRLKRWLYNGLHSLDFSFWYGKRPWWDLGVITLLLGGLALSATGFCLGIKRLWRDLRRQGAAS